MDSRSINITWNTPPADAINGIIAYYVVNVTVQNTKERFHYTLMNTELMIENLHPYYTYTVVVAAFTVAKGPFSAEFSITTPQDGRFYFSISWQIAITISATLSQLLVALQEILSQSKKLLTVLSCHGSLHLLVIRMD